MVGYLYCLFLSLHLKDHPCNHWPNVLFFLQSIYSFNGADISGFISFRNDFPNYKEVSLFLTDYVLMLDT